MPFKAVKISLIIILLISANVFAQNPEFKSQKVEIDGKTVNVVTAIPENREKNLPVVIFQSGAGTPLNNWNTVAREVSKFAPVFLYDRPGIGKSEMLDVPPTPEKISEHLHELLAKLNIKPPYILVGHSWGGPLINSYAVKYPDEVKGMVFVDETDILNIKASEKKAIKMLGISEEDFYSFNEAQKEYFKNAPSGIKAEYAVIDKYIEKEIDPKDFSPAIVVPTSYLIAGKMQDLPPDFPKLAFSINDMYSTFSTIRMSNFLDKITSNPDATLVFATNASHYIHFDDPDLVIEAIKRVTFPSIENKLLQALESKGLQGVQQEYTYLRSYYPKHRFNESLLNTLGYSLMQSGKMDEALVIFKLNTKEYPEEANPYDSLGDAYAAMGNVDEAKKLYEKASQLAEKQDHPNKEIYKSKYEKLKNQSKKK